MELRARLTEYFDGMVEAMLDATGGDLLVFLPGMAEIRRAAERRFAQVRRAYDLLAGG